jgi:hypothetical protein
MVFAQQAPLHGFGENKVYSKGKQYNIYIFHHMAHFWATRTERANKPATHRLYI